MASVPITGASDTSQSVLHKIDPITAIQDDIGTSGTSMHVDVYSSFQPMAHRSSLHIPNLRNLVLLVDGLSLAMFEALRSLRDAVAPESGNLGGNSSNNSNNQNEQADIDDLWFAYKTGDKEVVNQIHSSNGGIILQKREDFIRVHAKMEMEKDTELVQRLASSVLNKSSAIDKQVDSLPGMHRTKTEQLDRISNLLDLNKSAIDDLEAAYQTAKERRDACREYISNNACKALGIEKEHSL
jgi:hypothetical protein